MMLSLFCKVNGVARTGFCESDWAQMVWFRGEAQNLVGKDVVEKRDASGTEKVEQQAPSPALDLAAAAVY